MLSRGLNISPAVVASWPPPNYVNPQTRGPVLTYLSVILSGLALLVVIIRIYTRLFITKTPGIDDLLIVISLGFGIALSAMLIVFVNVHYLGYHVWDIPISTFSNHRLWALLCGHVFGVGITCVRVSVLLFYRRLYATWSFKLLVATWTGIVYNICFTIAGTLSITFLCNPVQATWLRYNPEWVVSNKWHCGREDLVAPVNSALSLLGDLFATLIPLVLVSRLTLSFWTMARLYLLFGVGFAVVGAGVARLVTACLALFGSPDFSWREYDIWLSALIELYVGILAASAPALAAFFRHVWGDGRPDVPAVNSGPDQGAFSSLHSDEKIVYPTSKRKGKGDGRVVRFSEAPTVVGKKYSPPTKASKFLDEDQVSIIGYAAGPGRSPSLKDVAGQSSQPQDSAMDRVGAFNETRKYSSANVPPAARKSALKKTDPAVPVIPEAFQVPGAVHHDQTHGRSPEQLPVPPPILEPMPSPNQIRNLDIRLAPPASTGQLQVLGQGQGQNEEPRASTIGAALTTDDKIIVEPERKESIHPQPARLASLNWNQCHPLDSPPLTHLATPAQRSRAGSEGGNLRGPSFQDFDNFVFAPKAMRAGGGEPRKSSSAIPMVGNPWKEIITHTEQAPPGWI